MGIAVVYDITDEQTLVSVQGWCQPPPPHAMMAAGHLPFAICHMPYAILRLICSLIRHLHRVFLPHCLPRMSLIKQVQACVFLVAALQSTPIFFAASFCASLPSDPSLSMRRPTSRGFSWVTNQIWRILEKLTASVGSSLQTNTRSNPPVTQLQAHAFLYILNSYQIPFYETSAKANVNVETAIMSMAKDVLHRLMAEESAAPRSDALVRPAHNSARLICFSPLAVSKLEMARVRMGLKAAADFSAASKMSPDSFVPFSLVWALMP